MNFGIIGCGKIFDRHADAIGKIPEANLCAITDISNERLTKFAKRYNISNAYKNYVDLLANDEIDVVVVCTPSGLHPLVSISALRAGKHVVCEKPMALNIADAKKVNETAKAEGRVFFEVKQNRYTPAIQALKSLIDDGSLGTLLMGNITVRWNRPQAYYDSNDWYGTISMDGGVVLNQAIHHIDLLQWICGKPLSVLSKTAILDHDIEAPDTALAIIQFENDVLANVEITTCAAVKNIEGSITVMGTKGTVKVGGPALNLFDIWEVEGIRIPVIDENPRNSNHYLFYKDVVKALLSNEPVSPLVTGQEGLKSLLIAESIFVSSKTNSEVIMDYDKENIR